MIDVKPKDDGKRLLTSSIGAEAMLLTSTRSVEEKMSRYPGLAQTGRGTALRYVFDCGNGSFYSIELGRDRVSVCIHSPQSPLYLMRDALLRLLSVLQLLSDDYEVRAKALIPHVVAVLARQQIEHYASEIDAKGAGRALQVCGETDLALARRIRLLLKENAELSAARSSLSSKIGSLAAKLVLFECGRDPSVSSISKETGLGRDEVMGALAGIRGLGYRAIFKNADRFELVRL